MHHEEFLQSEGIPPGNLVNYSNIQINLLKMLIMKGATQRCWEHQIAKTNKRIGVRLNITLRILKQQIIYEANQELQLYP